MKHIRWIWRFWQPARGWLYWLAVLTLLSSAVAVGYPMALRYLIDALKSSLDQGLATAAEDLGYKLAGIMLAIGLARALAGLYPGVRGLINVRLEMDIRQFYFAQIVHKDARFFQKFRTGDLVTRLSDDIGGWPKIAWFCCSGIFRAVESTSQFIFCMAVMLHMNWQLALLSTAPLPVMLYIFYRLRAALSRRSERRQKMISRTSDMLEAAFSGIRILKSFNAEGAQAREFGGVLKERVAAEYDITRLWLGVQQFYQAIQYSGQIVVVVAGGLMVIKGTLTLGEFYAFYVYLSMLLQPLLNIPQLFVSSRVAFACIDREIEIEEFPGPPADSALRGVPVERIESVELRGVRFAYEAGALPALDGVDLRLEAGRRVAVVGSVGCGKTTLLRVAAGLLTPQQGELRVNGRPLAQLKLADYRAHSGWVPQESVLFSETVADNVSFGRPLDVRRVEEALEMARVLEEMRALPGGLGEVLGQRGLTVSGGQKQRLAIARALAGGPDLLLMDDCTSALDAQNERAFWDSFKARYPRAACLIVTHRIATAREADEIYVLDGGRVAGRGTHAELAADCEEYRRLLSREELALAAAEADGAPEADGAAVLI